MSEPEEPTHPTEARPDGRAGFFRWLAELIVLVVIAFLLAMGIKQFVVQPFVIPSSSMEPTLQVGDRVLVAKFLYRFRPPQRGDIVVFLSPESSSVDYIKRVIAVEGQTVDVRKGTVFVDGKALAEPYVDKREQDTYTSEKPVTVPKGYVWLMGDNRTNSRDSRYFGPRPAEDLLGKAFLIYWPPSRVRPL